MGPLLRSDRTIRPDINFANLVQKLGAWFSIDVPIDRLLAQNFEPLLDYTATDPVVLDLMVTLMPSKGTHRLTSQRSVALH